MSFKAGDAIERPGRYLVQHDQRHVKDRIKVFKPDLSRYSCEFPFMQQMWHRIPRLCSQRDSRECSNFDNEDIWLQGQQEKDTGQMIEPLDGARLSCRQGFLAT
jgi:hypothetical protein